MRDTRFDELTRKLSGPQTRGSMLKTLLALAAGAALVPASALAGDADKPKRKSPICIAKGGRCTLKSGKNGLCCPHLRCKRTVCKVGGPCYRQCE
jgi:hypothetical protein